MALKLWSLDQQHQYHWILHKKGRSQAPPGPVNQTLGSCGSSDVLTSPSGGLPGSAMLHATHMKKVAVSYTKFRFNCVSGIYLATVSLGDSEIHLTWIKRNMQKRARLPNSESALIHTNYGILAEQSCNCSMTQFACM